MVLIAFMSDACHQCILYDLIDSFPTRATKPKIHNFCTTSSSCDVIKWGRREEKWERKSLKKRWRIWRHRKTTWCKSYVFWASSKYCNQKKDILVVILMLYFLFFWYLAREESIRITINITTIFIIISHNILSFLL